MIFFKNVLISRGKLLNFKICITYYPKKEQLQTSFYFGLMHLTHFEVEKSLPNDIKTFFYKNHKSLDVAGAEIGLKKGNQQTKYIIAWAREHML